MRHENEWLFDVMWDLSDKALAAGLPDVADKLEEAMDAYLAEHGDPAAQSNKFIRSCPQSTNITQVSPAEISVKMVRQAAARESFARLWARPKEKPRTGPRFLSSRSREARR